MERAQRIELIFLCLVEKNVVWIGTPIAQREMAVYQSAFARSLICCAEIKDFL